MIDLPKGEPTEQEISELTEMFPTFYPALRKKIEESRPKTHEDWMKFAKWHDDFIKNMPSVTPIEPNPDSYFKVYRGFQNKELKGETYNDQE